MKDLQKKSTHFFSAFAKSVLLCVTALFLTIQMAFAVDVNRASLEELDTIKGIGAKKAQAIITERNAAGPFKDAADLAARVKGLGDKSVANLMQAGLTINGSQSMGMLKPNNKPAMPSTMAPKTKPSSANTAPVDLSGGPANTPAPKAKTEAPAKKTKMIMASQTAANTSTPVKNDAKQGYPKATAEMTAKPAKAAKTPANSTPIMPASQQPAAKP
jgi:competence protein ComEA